MIDHCIGSPHNAAVTSVRDQPWLRVRGPAGPRTVKKMSKISGYETFSLGKPFVLKHFVSLGVSRRTVFSNLERLENGETLERKSGSDRKPLKLPQRKQEPAGETAVQQCWCVTALFGQEVQHQQLRYINCRNAN